MLQQHQYFQRACWKCRVSGLTPGLLDQNPPVNKTPRWFLNKTPGDSRAHLHVRSPEHKFRRSFAPGEGPLCPKVWIRLNSSWTVNKYKWIEFNSLLRSRLPYFFNTLILCVLTSLALSLALFHIICCISATASTCQAVSFKFRLSPQVCDRCQSYLWYPRVSLYSCLLWSPLSPFLTPLLLLFKSSDSSTRPYGMELAPGGIASLLLTRSVLFCARSGKSAGSWTPHLFHPEAQSLCPPAPPSLLAQSSQRGSRLALPAPPCPTIHQGCTTCKSLCQGPPQHSSSHQPGRGFLRTVSG